MMFQGRKVSKTYECLAPCRPTTRPRYGTVERLDPPAVFPLRRRSHITKLRGVLQAFEEPQAVNAETVIDLAAEGYPSMGGRFKNFAVSVLIKGRYVPISRSAACTSSFAA